MQASHHEDSTCNDEHQPSRETTSQPLVLWVLNKIILIFVKLKPSDSKRKIEKSFTKELGERSRMLKVNTVGIHLHDVINVIGKNLLGFLMKLAMDTY